MVDAPSKEMPLRSKLNYFRSKVQELREQADYLTSQCALQNQICAHFPPQDFFPGQQSQAPPYASSNNFLGGPRSEIRAHFRQEESRETQQPPVSFTGALYFHGSLFPFTGALLKMPLAPILERFRMKSESNKWRHGRTFHIKLSHRMVSSRLVGCNLHGKLQVLCLLMPWLFLGGKVIQVSI